MNVPSARSLDILDYNLQRAEINCSDGVEGYIEEDEGPLEKGVDCIGARDFVNLVLDEEVNQGDKSSEKGAAKDLSVVDSLWVDFWAQGNASNGPWEGSDEV